MNGEMLQYYFYKNRINNLPNSIKNALEYDDDLLFCLSTFSSTGFYFRILNPFKKDRYKLDNFFNSNMVEIIIKDALLKIKKDDNLKELMFIYALECSYLLNSEINNYYKELNLDISKHSFLNMVDYFYSLKYDNFDVSKNKISKKFLNGFNYYDYMENIIHNPCIKYYNFFCSRSYYSRSIKRKKQFYKYLSISKHKIKYFILKFYDLLFNHFGKPKAADYVYLSKVDTRILNLTKDLYIHSLDEVIENTAKKCDEKIKAINDFLFNNKEKKFNELFKE
ncbi:MAG: hypothetical protein ACI35S_03125 [Anaeroplasma sp.]